MNTEQVHIKRRGVANKMIVANLINWSVEIINYDWRNTDKSRKELENIQSWLEKEGKIGDKIKIRKKIFLLKGTVSLTRTQERVVGSVITTSPIKYIKRYDKKSFCAKTKSGSIYYLE